MRIDKKNEMLFKKYLFQAVLPMYIKIGHDFYDTELLDYPNEIQISQPKKLRLRRIFPIQPYNHRYLK